MHRSQLSSLVGILSFSILVIGCSFLAKFNNPLTPQDELVADIWPILTGAEKKEIRKLQTVESAQSFIDKFWDDLDPTPDTKINEFRVEYETRLNYVHIHYPYKRGWTHSDRARVYLIYGPPEDIHFEPWLRDLDYKGIDVKAWEIWVYPKMIASTLPPTSFNQIDPHLMQFVFADYSGVGRYIQVYSNVPGEKTDSRFLGNL
ncbi:hypothetical protein CEE37_08530 [candidate division LCP-89 bacterium B3_LCP]|uniref:GWxTD domain-containing protein n=1 Tax=candidate division LCP-89 bacterium B3_LCP TaxID=2012998 RepID=A0A532UZI1_UNCL8|nr:MAG: hypothetical protein CEE37_08530 [candidate division LCP-89 bacterium B3_LCP]